MASHAAAERFVLLDAGVAYQNVPQNLLYLPRDYKAVSIGDTITNTAAQSFTYSGVNLKPLSSVHANATKDGAGDITLSWVRRTRGLGEWQDNVDVPLNETTEAYEIDVVDGGSVVRTITATIPSVAYTLAEQTTDLGGAATNLTFNIYQLSSTVGRGYAAEVSYTS